MPGLDIGGEAKMAAAGSVASNASDRRTISSNCRYSIHEATPWTGRLHGKRLTPKP